MDNAKLVKLGSIIGGGASIYAIYSGIENKNKTLKYIGIAALAIIVIGNIPGLSPFKGPNAISVQPLPATTK